MTFKKTCLVVAVQPCMEWIPIKKKKKPSAMSIQAFLDKFDKRLFKTKTYGTTMSDDILVYLLLESANLSTHREELIKATILDLQYNIVIDQLKKHSVMPRDRSQQKQRTLLKLKKPSWKKISAIWKSSTIICKTYYHQNMNTTHFKIQWISSRVKNLKPSTTKEITEIMYKSIAIKIDKPIKHLNQEHLYITTIENNNNPKLDVTRIRAIKMAHNYDVTFAKALIIWLSDAQKRVILTTHKRLYCTSQISTILTNWRI